MIVGDNINYERKEDPMDFDACEEVEEILGKLCTSIIKMCQSIYGLDIDVLTELKKNAIQRLGDFYGQAF